MTNFQKIKNISLHSIRLGTPIIDAIKQINDLAPQPQFLMVMDDFGTLVGTITDGDIRKALINNNDLKGPVEDFMQSRPIYAYSTDNESVIRSTMANVRSTIKFIPIVNAKHHLEGAIYLSDIARKDMAALIMAGGFGSRLKHETAKKPKALVEVDDLPLIENVLRNIESAGIKNIFVSVHYLGEMIDDYIRQTGRINNVRVLRETKPMGTAGAITLIPPEFQTDLLISNCDLITNLRMNDFIDFHNASQADASIAVASHSYKVPFGVIRSSPSGQFQGIEEKPTITNYVSAGIYCISSLFMRRVTHVGAIDMPKYLGIGAKLGLNVSLFPIHEEWEDVGTLAQLKKLKAKKH